MDLTPYAYLGLFLRITAAWWGWGEDGCVAWVLDPANADVFSD